MLKINQLLETVAQLRDPKTGCPWDIKQTFDSILPHMLEESYEVAEAIHTQDRSALREELGDLLLQVIFLSQLAKEEGSFDFNDVANDLYEKLIFRHPHVFGDKSANNSEEALQYWEAQKAETKQQKGYRSILDDLPYALPALTRANKLQKRCAKVGFDWDNPNDVADKVEEEWQEVQQELNNLPIQPEKLEEELGDLFFASVNLCRHHKIDAEDCLRKANVKFENRFKKIEQYLANQEKFVSDCTLEELDFIWNEIKTMEKIDKLL
ncbi:nucleoside triphosphate pyrophosphohydrolase [Vespertiliibacter pulmonis]|uniref:Nucleoside triphosphate pyrophosphohydrolase n=1 Tax=Vespertiliibacter pulmonis TaxID=1443036 RepID=A0A3N4W8H4_9PAST|nr:nucleoside triphosphate pyrophosphohydrolase [Vespertiliibacter pulmonis]QLB21432.1 nucleoside triphosphate pyrophosphohydrolase [Vespertiliibacter pulmonis]RPE85847.1 ATP diphosphatase [Vespertiliibacter pulmonis]